MSEADCWADFRLYRHDIYRLAELLNLPDKIVCYNRSTVDKIEGLCILLKRFSYPCRYGDMVPRSVPELSMISNKVMNLVYENFHHKLRDFNQQTKRIC